MDHDEHCARQEAVLQDVLAFLQEDPHVLGVLVRGSYVKGQNDAFSDIDMDCYLRDEARSGREELYEGIGRIRPLLCKLWLYGRNALYLYDDGVRLDLDFHPPSRLAKGSRLDATILHDPDGRLAAELGTSSFVPPAPTEYFPDEAAMVDWFFWMFRQAYCWAKRAAQGGRKGRYDGLNGAIESLRQVRDKLVEIRRWMEGRWEPLDRIDPAMADRLADTFPSFDTADVLKATRLLLAEFARVCSDYCTRVGIAYPEGKALTLQSLLDEFDILK